MSISRKDFFKYLTSALAVINIPSGVHGEGISEETPKSELPATQFVPNPYRDYPNPYSREFHCESCGEWQTGIRHWEQVGMSSYTTCSQCGAIWRPYNSSPNTNAPRVRCRYCGGWNRASEFNCLNCGAVVEYE